MVKDLEVLIALFGAVGQTGLAGMPNAVFLALQYQRIAPNNRLWSLLNLLILALRTAVMMAGCVLVVVEFVQVQGGVYNSMFNAAIEYGTLVFCSTCYTYAELPAI
jgi:hypothetical protein